MRAILLYAMPTAIAAGMGISLIWVGRYATKGTYKLVFLVALVGLATTVLRPTFEMSIDAGQGRGVLLALLALAALAAPFILLIEAGIAGYQGFTSWVRWLLLCLTFLGSVGLIASLPISRFLRR